MIALQVVVQRYYAALSDRIGDKNIREEVVSYVITEFVDAYLLTYGSIYTDFPPYRILIMTSVCELRNHLSQEYLQEQEVKQMSCFDIDIDNSDDDDSYVKIECLKDYKIVSNESILGFESPSSGNFSLNAKELNHDELTHTLQWLPSIRRPLSETDKKEYIIQQYWYCPRKLPSGQCECCWRIECDTKKCPEAELRITNQIWKWQDL